MQQGGRVPASVELPRSARSTRGKRYQASLADDDAKADEEFWNQDFFAEDQVDEDYNEEKVSEDVPDSDFDESEDEDDDAAPEEEKEKPKKKVLKPPGSGPAPKPRPKPAPKKEVVVKDEDMDFDLDDEDEEDERPTTSAKGRKAKAPSPPVFQAPSLRRSTVAKTTEAKLEREERAAERKPRKRAAKDGAWRPMTQQELLAEAARTEVENSASLKQLLAMEEETKRKAAVIKKRYQGPLVKFHSRKVNDTEQTTLNVINMNYAPPWLRRMRAPPPPHQPRCLITGMPAPYRDPQTKQPFASAAAFKRLRAQSAEGGAAVAPVAALAAAAAAPPPPAGPVMAVGDRGVQSERSKQVQAELEGPDTMLVPPPPRGPYELPVELMGLVVDLRAKLRQGYS